MGCMERSLSLWCFQEYDRTSEDYGNGCLLFIKEKEFLRQYFSEGFLWDAWRGPSLYGVSRNMIEHQKTMEMDAFYSLGEGGVLAGLWKMAEASEIGLFADLRKIPVRQETIEICERFNLNPYKLKAVFWLVCGKWLRLLK